MKDSNFNNNFDNLTTVEDVNDVNSTILVRIAENGHSTLFCKEDEIISKITDWYKDGKLLNASFRNNMGNRKKEPHLTIDACNNLYILRATKNEEGLYKCTFDGIKVHEYIVKVVSIAKILDQDFIRYSMYLGFILSLTITCYCAGLCVAWHRRTSFADPLNLQYNYKQKVIKRKHEQDTLLNKMHEINTYNFKNGDVE